MKILVCHNYYKNLSGEDLVISEDIQILRHHNCTVIEYKRSNTESESFPFLKRLESIPNAIYSVSTFTEIKRLVVSNLPDVALVQNVFPLISPSIYSALHSLGVPIIQLVYNYRLICPNAILYTRGKICERCVKGNFAHAIRYRCYRDSFALSALYAGTLAVHRYIRDIRNLISAYVTPDEFLKRKLIEGGFPGDRVFPLLNPFDVSRYAPNRTDEGYFVYFGRLVREKGIFTLLKAMRLVPAARLIVVGGGAAEEDAKKYAAQSKLEGVKFLGPVYGEDLNAILSKSVAVVVPTEWYDNSPLVVHQAFALGKAVIASDIDGIPEIVTDGENGLLFPPGDFAQLAVKMQILLVDKGLQQQLGMNARKKAETEFTSDRRFEGLMHVVAFAREKRIHPHE